MLSKTHTRLHAVVVDDAQSAKSQMLGIVIASKRERMPAVQPARARNASVTCLSDFHHGFLLTISFISREVRLLSSRGYATWLKGFCAPSARKRPCNS